MKKKYIYAILTLMLFLPIKISAASYVDCGSITKIPAKIPQICSLIVLIIEIAVPVILVVMGLTDLLKAIVAQKEDEITKARNIFVKRLIIGALVFFVIAIGKFLVSVIASDDKDNAIDCISCFLENKCS